jgi:hypothetical protein
MAADADRAGYSAAQRGQCAGGQESLPGRKARKKGPALIAVAYAMPILIYEVLRTGESWRVGLDLSPEPPETPLANH